MAVLLGLFLALLPLELALIMLSVLLVGVFVWISPLFSVLVMLMVAPMRMLILTEAPLALPLDMGFIVLGLVLLTWLIAQVPQNGRVLCVSWNRVYIPLIGFLVATGATVFNALSVGVWLSEWLKWIIVFALVIFVLNVGHWEWFIFAYVLAGAANAVIGVYIFFGGSGALHLLINDRFFRAFGTFGQPNPFGGFMGMIAPVAVMMTYAYGQLILNDWHKLRRVRWDRPLAFGFYGCASLLVVSALVMSWSRGAWLGFGVSILAMVFTLPRKLWQSVMLLIIMTASLLVLWHSGQIPATISDRIASATTEIFTLDDVRAVDVTPENYPIIERLAHWQAALNITHDHPWLGVGFGNYEIAYDQYRLLNWRDSLGHAHNYYLNILSETGIVGFIVYLSMIGYMLYVTWESRKYPDIVGRSVIIGVIGVLVYSTVHSLTDNLYVNNVFMHFGTLLGVLAVLQPKVESIRYGRKHINPQIS